MFFHYREKGTVLADTSKNSPNEWPPTALSVWLEQSKFTANKLATEAGVTPRSVYALVRGDSGLVAPKTLICISNYTGLLIDDLVRPYYNTALATDTGDKRFNLMLAKIGLHMHSNRCEDKLSPYISPKFRCGGTAYAKKNQPYMTFKEMANANSSNSFDITSVMMSAHWYNPGTNRRTQSRTLHTYWRAMITDREAHTTTDTTFVVYEFEKSIEEMEETDLYPQITSWWWHRPVELHAEITQRRVNGFLGEALVEAKHAEMLDGQFTTQVQEQHLNSK
jgi:hypothetical protein